MKAFKNQSVGKITALTADAHCRWAILSFCRVARSSNNVSPKWDVTVLARHAVSAARPPTRPAAADLPGSVTDDNKCPRAKQYWSIKRASNS